MRTRRYSPLRESAGFAVVASLFVLAMVFGFTWTFSLSSSAAENVAREEGGLTEITKLERNVFAWCRKGYVGYTVTGVRNEKPATIKVCVTLPESFSYVR